MSAQVEAVRNVQHAEEDRLAPGDLLVADARPEAAVGIVEIQRRQIDHVLVAADLEAGRAIPAIGHLEKIHVAEIVVDTVVVVGAHLHRTGQVFTEGCRDIQFAARRLQVPVIGLGVVRTRDLGRQAIKPVHVVVHGPAVVEIALLVEGVLVVGDLVGHLLADEARDVQVQRERRGRGERRRDQRDTAYRCSESAWFAHGSLHHGW